MAPTSTGNEPTQQDMNSCRHDKRLPGCLVCDRHNLEERVKEVNAEGKKASEECRRLQQFIKEKSMETELVKQAKRDHNRQQQLAQDSQGELNTLKNFQQDLINRITRKERDASERGLTPPDLWDGEAKNYQERTLQAMKRLFNGSYRIVSYVDPAEAEEDEQEPATQTSRNLSNIPASLSYTLHTPLGLELALKLGESRNWRPNQAIGQRPGPAVMSVSAAAELTRAVRAEKTTNKAPNATDKPAGGDNVPERDNTTNKHTEVTETQLRQLSVADYASNSKLNEQQQMDLVYNLKDVISMLVHYFWANAEPLIPDRDRKDQKNTESAWQVPTTTWVEGQTAPEPPNTDDTTQKMSQVDIASSLISMDRDRKEPRITRRTWVDFMNWLFAYIENCGGMKEFHTTVLAEWTRKTRERHNIMEKLPRTLRQWRKHIAEDPTQVPMDMEKFAHRDPKIWPRQSPSDYVGSQRPPPIEEELLDAEEILAQRELYKS